MPDPLIEAYLTWTTNHKNASPNTTAARRSILTNAPPHDATRETWEEWWNTRTHLSPSTRQTDLAHLRTWFKWLDKWEHRNPDQAWPISRLEAPTVHRGRPRPFTQAQLDQILGHLEDDPELRRAVLLGAWAGLRIAETAALMWAEVDFESSQILVVNGKGGKDRLVAVDFTLLDALGQVVDGGSVVTGGAPVSAGVLTRRLNRAIKAAGVEGSSHQLRHRWFTLAVRASEQNYFAVARMGGHASLTTTMQYAEPSGDAFRQIAAAVVQGGS